MHTCCELESALRSKRTYASPPIPKIMTLKTLADVRTLLRHLPEDRCERHTGHHVAAELEQAAAGADTVDGRRSVAAGADVGERRVQSQVNQRRFEATAVIGCVSSETARSRMTQLRHRPAFHVAVAKPGLTPSGILSWTLTMPSPKVGAK